MANKICVIAVGEPAEGCSIDGNRISMLRPRSTIQKTFEADAVLQSHEDCFSAAVQPSLREALSCGRGTCVYALGAEKSGKSTTVRGSDGIAVKMARDLFAALDEQSLASGGTESKVAVSGVLCAIMPSAGPSKEVLLDALGSYSQGNAPCLTVHEQADGLPTAAPFYCKGQTQAEAADAAAAEALVLQALDRCAQEEGGSALRVHLLLTLTVRQRQPLDNTERAFTINLVDVAGVPRPSTGGTAGGRAAGGGGAAGAAAGRGRGAARGRGGGPGGAGEDPFVKALQRIIDALPDATPKTHIPYRDSKLTRLLSPSLGGGALAVPLVHVRMAHFEEAEAVLSQCAKLRALSKDVKGGDDGRNVPSRTAGGWWSPVTELQVAEETACALASALGMERAGLVSSAIQLDMDASDELLQLQESLLRSERLQQRVQAWAASPAAPPAQPLSTQPLTQANSPPDIEAVDLSKLQLLKAKTGGGATKWTAGGGFGAATR